MKYQPSPVAFFIFSFLLLPQICWTMSTSSTQSRLPTFRRISSTLSSISSESNDYNVITKERVQKMAQHAKDGTPLTDEEVQDICNGIQNLVPEDAPINFDELKELLKSVAHLSHKNWEVTSANSEKLSRTLSISSSTDDAETLSRHAKQLLERILKDGNWQTAVDNAPPMGSVQRKPWAVLVTGVNGIRKTTSMYQPWFDQLLSEAMCSPPDADTTNKPKNLPTGSNSFFRQLDHMICTLTNEEFGKLYSWAAAQLPQEDSIPSDQVVQDYSDYKAAIFSRYRTLSELLGGLLLREAQKVNINCLMETSGRDVAMFHYVDHFFDSTKYNKLALHFTINDLECAKTSVDRRMVQEIQDGAKAVKSQDVFDIIYANAGGPYGSKVLEGIQKDSDKVWEAEVLSGNVGSDWYKATIAIDAHDSKPWTAQAVKPDGSLGTKFTFERK